MSAESLRKQLEDSYKQQSGKEKAGPHAIANRLAAQQYLIFESSEEEVGKSTLLEVFGYEGDIHAFRKDASVLICRLKGELSEDDWLGYFGRRKERNDLRS